jgi:hypothetical protein
MACYHKFYNYLMLDRLNFVPTVLIVGTFNPAWPESNYAEWFYGRISNNYFWDVLPRLYNSELNLRFTNASAWKDFCSKYKIALTDLITCIDDADKDNPSHQKLIGEYLDTSIAKSFQQIEPTNIVDLLKKWPSIKNVYLTRQGGNSYYDGLWASVEEYCNKSGIEARCLLTPSASARFKIKAYKLENPKDATPLRNFIYHSWRQHWHKI